MHDADMNLNLNDDIIDNDKNNNATIGSMLDLNLFSSQQDDLNLNNLNIDKQNKSRNNVDVISEDTHNNYNSDIDSCNNDDDIGKFKDLDNQIDLKRSEFKFEKYGLKIFDEFKQMKHYLFNQ